VLFENLTFGNGFILTDEGGCEYSLDYQETGVLFSGESCGSTMTTPTKVTNMTIGNGLTITGTENAATLSFGGISANRDDECISQGNELPGCYNSLHFGKGLNVNIGSTSELDIGLGMLVGGISAAEIFIGSGLNAISQGSCGVMLSASGTTVPFELYDDVTPGSTGKNAWPLKADLTADTSATKILVSDGILGDVRALGTVTKTGGTPSTGARGYAIIGPDGNYQIFNIQRVAKRCKCQLTAALTATTSSCTVDNITPTDGGQNPVLNTSATYTLTVYIQLNPSSSGGFAGADNTWCYIEWHEDDDKWYIYEMPCGA
jgi:hypothetical protein